MCACVNELACVWIFCVSAAHVVRYVVNLNTAEFGHVKSYQATTQGCNCLYELNG